MRMICDCAFAGCTALKEVHLPARLTTLGNRAFDGCTQLTNSATVLPGEIRNVGTGVFGNCPKITSIALPRGLESHNIRLLRPLYLPTPTEEKNAESEKQQKKKGRTAKSTVEVARAKAAAKAEAAAARRRAEEEFGLSEDFGFRPMWKLIKLGRKPQTPFEQLRTTLRKLGRNSITTEALGVAV